MKNKIRIQKAIALSSVASRRAAEELIRRGKVKVNGSIAKIGQSVDPESDDISVNGKKIVFEEKEYFILNKPLGFISTTSDDLGRKSVIDIVKTNKRIVPVGRLDKNTTGLLILTNDGELANKLTHPKFLNEKEYEAYVEVPSRWEIHEVEKRLARMAKGVKIANKFKTSPAKVKILKKNSADRYTLSIAIHEGHKHQVRQMIDSVGFSVVGLRRVRMGSITLGDLKEGEYRPLTDEEIEKLKT